MQRRSVESKDARQRADGARAETDQAEREAEQATRAAAEARQAANAAGPHESPGQSGQTYLNK